MTNFVFPWGSDLVVHLTVGGVKYRFVSELGATYSDEGNLLGVLRIYDRV